MKLYVFGSSALIAREWVKSKFSASGMKIANGITFKTEVVINRLGRRKWDVRLWRYKCLKTTVMN